MKSLQMTAPKPAKGTHIQRDKGLIYFVEALGLDRLKLGYTTGRFDARLAVVQTGSPVRIQPLLIWRHATKADEQQLHRLFAKWRHHGEWYELNFNVLCHMEMLEDSPQHDTLVWPEALAAIRERLIAQVFDKNRRIEQNGGLL
jgi:hypothetical protein